MTCAGPGTCTSASCTCRDGDATISRAMVGMGAEGGETAGAPAARMAAAAAACTAARDGVTGWTGAEIINAW